MTTPKEPGRSLHRKLAQVMYEADRIPKNGSFKQPGEYGHFKFVQAGDAADVIRKALAEVGVSMIPTAIELLSESEHVTAKGGTMTTMTVRTTWTLTDGDSGETAVIQSMGSGADSGDNASPKAQTNAMKYALLMGFLLSTGDDPETSDSSDRRPKRAATAEPEAELEPTTTHDGGLIGVASVGKGDADFQSRQDRQHGFRLAFRLVQGRKGLKVMTFGPLAEAIATIRSEVEGQRVTVWGTMHDETFTPKGTDREVTYQVVHAERIATPDFILPAPAGDTEPAEAESVPLFDAPLTDEERQLIAGGLK
jgi:hypothetical protein